MSSSSSWRALLMATAALMFSAAAVATPEEDATKVAQDWVKAVTARDIDAQMRLLPKTFWPREGDRERDRKLRLHDKEVAMVNGESYLSFDLQPPRPAVTLDKTVIVLIPYRSVTKVATGRLQRESTLIAVGDAGGSNWSIFDGSGQVVRSLKRLIPAYQGNPPVPPTITRQLKADQ